MAPKNTSHLALSLFSKQKKEAGFVVVRPVVPAFTLVEMVISMGLVGLMLIPLLLTSSATISSKVLKSRAKTQIERNIAVVMNTMTEDVAKTQALAVSGGRWTNATEFRYDYLNTSTGKREVGGYRLVACGTSRCLEKIVNTIGALQFVSPFGTLVSQQVITLPSTASFTYCASAQTAANVTNSETCGTTDAHVRNAKWIRLLDFRLSAGEDNATVASNALRRDYTVPFSKLYIDTNHSWSYNLGASMGGEALYITNSSNTELAAFGFSGTELDLSKLASTSNSSFLWGAPTATNISHTSGDRTLLGNLNGSTFVRLGLNTQHQTFIIQTSNPNPNLNGHFLWNLGMKQPRFIPATMSSLPMSYDQSTTDQNTSLRLNLSSGRSLAVSVDSSNRVNLNFSLDSSVPPNAIASMVSPDGQTTPVVDGTTSQGVGDIISFAQGRMPVTTFTGNAYNSSFNHNSFSVPSATQAPLTAPASNSFWFNHGATWSWSVNPERTMTDFLGYGVGRYHALLFKHPSDPTSGLLEQYRHENSANTLCPSGALHLASNANINFNNYGGLAISEDMSQAYVLDTVSNRVTQYALPTFTPNPTTPATVTPATSFPVTSSWLTLPFGLFYDSASGQVFVSSSQLLSRNGQEFFIIQGFNSAGQVGSRLEIRLTPTAFEASQTSVVTAMNELRNAIPQRRYSFHINTLHKRLTIADEVNQKLYVFNIAGILDS